MPTPVYGSSSDDGLLKSFGPFKITSTSEITQTVIIPHSTTYDRIVKLSDTKVYNLPHKESTVESEE